MIKNIFSLSFSLAVAALVGCAPATIQQATAPQPTGPADSTLITFVTTKGEFDVMLRRHWAPHGTARVEEAVDSGFYNGARFFRALRGFVVQFGIAADPAVTAQWRERRIPDDSVTESNRKGTVTFAAGGPGTRTVQLFVNLRDNPRLDWLDFPPLGEVVRGWDVVSALHTGYGEGAPSGNGPPQNRISSEGEEYLAAEFPLLDKIESARIVKRWYPEN